MVTLNKVFTLETIFNFIHTENKHRAEPSSNYYSMPARFNDHEYHRALDWFQRNSLKDTPTMRTDVWFWNDGTTRWIAVTKTRIPRAGGDRRNRTIKRYEA